MIKTTNPILSGFYPDPSVCRVGEDFYLVNSSFSYFPGVPIFQSRNLADWKQIGNILDRESQIPLKGCRHSEGIFAPTIRYHEGTFYMITTNVSGGGNFIVTAENPAGPWSDPYILGENAPGIDPSLFFDEDGSCYYVGTRPNPQGVRYNGDWEIWVQKLDLTTMKLVGESHAIWKGALKDVIWPEGPHLYKKDGYYYVMNAEGGTGPDHAVTIARSKNLFGPYENNPKNPILTHRHLGKEYPIVYVGHADLVDDIHGNWYLVMLASRRCEGYIGLGRETFLAKVIWEDGWPIVNPGIGKLEDVVELPFEGEALTKPRIQTLKNLQGEAYDVVMLRNADRNSFCEVSKDSIQLKYLPVTLKDLSSPAYLGLRQLSYQYEAVLDITVHDMADGEETGMVILQSNEFHTLLRVKKAEAKDTLVVQTVKCLGGKDTILAEYESDQFKAAGSNNIKLKLRGYGQKADFLIQLHEEIPVLLNTDIHEMSTEIAGGFVGNTIGVYATANGKASESSVKINDFSIYSK